MIGFLRGFTVLAGVFAGLWGMADRAAATSYLDQAAWTAALPGGAQFLSFPSYTALSTDAFGSPGATGSHNSAGGAFSGSFGCNSFVFPCSGAYQITYTLPFQIIGFDGQLAYNNGFYPFSPLFPVPLSPQSRYDGYYGELFAPTSTITLLWQPGLLSTDSFATFSFADVRVVIAVPEPGALALLASALLVLFGTVVVGRRRRSEQRRVAI